MGIIFLIVYLFLFFAFFFTLNTPYMRAICKYILLRDFQFNFGGVTLTYDFNEIGAYFGQCYSGDSFNQHYYPAVALALDFHKISFGAIKCTAMDTHSCAFADVYFFGAQVGDVFVVCRADGDELLHLAVGDSDWDVLSALWPGVVLQEIDSLFECLDSLSCRVDKDQVVYCRKQLSPLDSIVSIYKSLFHRNEAFNAFLVKIVLGYKFPAVGRAHCKPKDVIVVFHGVLLCRLGWFCCRKYILLAP